MRFINTNISIKRFTEKDLFKLPKTLITADNIVNFILFNIYKKIVKQELPKNQKSGI